MQFDGLPFCTPESSPAKWGALGRNDFKGPVWWDHIADNSVTKALIAFLVFIFSKREREAQWGRQQEENAVLFGSSKCSDA